jgi:flagellin-like hook-associated protein FlgL
MKLSLNTNIGSLTAQNQLLKASEKLQTSFERLSSGLRINRASDDPAGLAMASALQTDSRLMAQAVRNVNDGISLLNVAEGALQELSSILQRQAELAQQAGTGTYSLAQRQAINSEANALVLEFNRIVESTEFNGKKPLQIVGASLAIQAGVDSTDSISLSLAEQLGRAAGDGTFNVFTSVAVSSDYTCMALQTQDLDGDGMLDLVAADRSGSAIVIALGNGDGSFSAGISYSSGTDSRALVLGDINNDGDLDIATADTDGDSINILLGNGNGTFNSPVSLIGGNGPRDIALADFNGDGNADLLVAEALNSRASIHFGNGDGTFQARTQVTSASWIYAVEAGDFNQDGHMDFAAGSASNELRVHLNNGDGTFRIGGFIYDRRLCR